jgi:hypothetical protein
MVRRFEISVTSTRFGCGCPGPNPQNLGHFAQGFVPQPKAFSRTIADTSSGALIASLRRSSCGEAFSIVLKPTSFRARRRGSVPHVVRRLVCPVPGKRYSLQAKSRWESTIATLADKRAFHCIAAV